MGEERKSNMEEDLSKFSQYFGEIALLDEQNLQLLRIQQQQQHQQQLLFIHHHQQQMQIQNQQQQQQLQIQNHQQQQQLQIQNQQKQQLQIHNQQQQQQLQIQNHQQQQQLQIQNQQKQQLQIQNQQQQQQLQNQNQQQQRQLQIQNQQHQQQTIDYKRLTSFLEYDDSFFSPWNWKPTKASVGSSYSPRNLKTPIGRGNVSSSSSRAEQNQQSRHSRFQPRSSFPGEISEVKSEEASSSMKAADFERSFKVSDAGKAPNP